MREHLDRKFKIMVLRLLWLMITAIGIKAEKHDELDREVKDLIRDLIQLGDK